MPRRADSGAPPAPVADGRPVADVIARAVTVSVPTEADATDPLDPRRLGGFVRGAIVSLVGDAPGATARAAGAACFATYGPAEQMSRLLVGSAVPTDALFPVPDDFSPEQQALLLEAALVMAGLSKVPARGRPVAITCPVALEPFVRSAAARCGIVVERKSSKMPLAGGAELRDLVVCFAPDREDFELAVDMVGDLGTVVVCGPPSTPSLIVPDYYRNMILKEASIVGVSGTSPEHWPAAIEFVRGLPAAWHWGRATVDLAGRTTARAGSARLEPLLWLEIGRRGDLPCVT